MLTRILITTGACLAMTMPAAADPGDAVTNFTFQGAAVGLVAVTQNAAGSQLAFTLSGLKPNAKYRLVVSKRGCFTSKGTILKRNFRTNSKGVAWDPVLVASTAKPRSVRIEKGGQVVVCNPGPQRLFGSVDVVKVSTPGTVVTVSQTKSLWRIAMAISGLPPRARYEFRAKQGGCADGSVNVLDDAFATDKRGFGTLEIQRSPVAGRTIDAVEVQARGGGQVYFCQSL